MKTDSAKTSRAVEQRPSSAANKKPSGNRVPRVPTEDEAGILYGEKHQHEKSVPWIR